MKRILALGVSMVLALSVAPAAFVFAETTTGATIPTTTTTETKTTETTAEVTARNARVEKRKADLKTKLTNAQKLRVQAKCIASQVLLGTINTGVKGIETSRTEVYKNITDRLTDLSTKLKNKSADTTALDADITTLKGQITTFNTDLTTYKQAVSDLVVIDCKTDPDGFKASLDAARTALTAVNKDAVAIRTYLTGTIKPLLVTIRAQLEPAKAPTSTTTGGQ